MKGSSVVAHDDYEYHRRPGRVNRDSGLRGTRGYRVWRRSESLVVAFVASFAQIVLLLYDPHVRDIVCVDHGCGDEVAGAHMKLSKQQSNPVSERVGETCKIVERGRV